MPLPFMAVAAGASALGSLFQTGLGVSQLIKARQYRMGRPTYEIPDEVSQGLGLRQQLLNARMPGAAEAERNIYESGAASLANAQQGAMDSASLLASAAGNQGAMNRALRKLSIQEDQDYERRVQGLERQQSQMAQYRDKEFDINKMQPYQEAAATRSALIQGGLQNVAGGIQSAGATAGKIGQLDELSGGDITNIINALRQRRMANQYGGTRTTGDGQIVPDFYSRPGGGGYPI